MPRSKFLFLDATFLKFAGDFRGIPQVLFLLIDVCAEPVFRGRIRFLSSEGAAEKHLLSRGVRGEDVVLVSDLPLLGRYERFHGLGSTYRYGKALQGQAVGIVHPEPRGVTRLPLPQVALWYDLLQLQGAWSSWRKPTRFIFLLYKYRMAARARGIAISEHTRREVLARFPSMDPEKITALWLGTRTGLASPGTSGALRFPLECIYVGALDGRKNVFAMLANLGNIFGDREFRLHLVGKISPPQQSRAEDILKTHGGLDSVEFHGLLSDTELRALMVRCDITLFPSLGEGFGLPVVEAMAQGHLVFAFRNTSIIEVAGDGAVLVENSDFKAWGRALDKLIENPAQAADLRRRALERSLLFTEEAMKARYRTYLLNLADELGAGMP